jgi:CRISPR-associated protein Cas1
MPTACLSQPGLQVRLRSERLEVYGRTENGGPETLLREIPLRDLDRLIVSDSVHFSAPAIGEILRSGIPMQVFSWKGSFLGNFLPAQNHHGLSRLAQYRRTLEPEFALQMAGRIVTAKLYNQRRVIQRLNASRQCERPKADCGIDGAAGNEAGTGESEIRNQKSEIENTLAWLDSLFASIRDSRTIDELRGYEGTATARYFRAWASFSPKRSHLNDAALVPAERVNACISFASTVVYNEAVAFCHAHGLDPALGLLHSTENGRWSRL